MDASRMVAHIKPALMAAHRKGMLQGMALVGILLLAQTLVFGAILYAMGVGL